MNSQYRAILRSDRVTVPTARVLFERATTGGDTDRALSPAAFATLDAVTRRLIPQAGGVDFVDIAARVDQTLGRPNRSGWRYATLPPHHEAYERGLCLIDTIARKRHGVAFPALESLAKDEALYDVAAGRLDGDGFGASMWFEDLLVSATEAFVSHPATLAMMGYSGMAFLPRWADVGLNSKQPWEPTVP